MTGPRDHGGDLDAAIARFGGDPGDWIDLSTGINRAPWPIPPLPDAAWRALPRAGAEAACVAAARRAYRLAPEADCLPLAGAQAAIQLLPRLRPPGRVAVLAPTYNEHAAAFRAAGWEATETSDFAELAQADAAVVVNPNNPDGRRIAPETLLELSKTVDLLVVDESFCDVAPELSIAPRLGRSRLLVLRSFGKFYGLAGARLGFALGSEAVLSELRAAAGPWAVSGPALEIGRAALTDAGWAEAARRKLAAEARALDRIAQAAGWRGLGGTTLFRLYDTPDAASAQDRLGRARIWSRIFPYSPTWLRLGVPGNAEERARLAEALA